MASESGENHGMGRCGKPAGGQLMPELEELAAAMAQAQVDLTTRFIVVSIEMKEELSGLVVLRSIGELFNSN